MFTTLPPLTLYIHLPWCARKCPYCDFNSHEVRSAIPETEYVDALIADLEQDLPQVWGRTCHAVFIGGGTPSLFSPASLERLLSAVRARLPLAPDAEITLEANPGSSEAGKFAGFREAGVNRLSIGVQSFNAGHLSAIGRVHGPDEAFAAAEAAPAAGFDNFNLDLMHGLPGQSPEEALEDVERALACDPTHLSCYQLTLEPNTRFHRHPPELPDEEAVWRMQEAIRNRLAEAGYRQYEVSAFAREGRQCRHNLNYWRFGDYLGIGAGAHAKITLPDRIERTAKVAAPRPYMQKAGAAGRIASQRTLDSNEVVFEFMLNALRLREPVAIADFQQRTGRTLASLGDALKSAERDGLVRIEKGALSTTERGYRFLNELLERFLPEGTAEGPAPSGAVKTA